MPPKNESPSNFRPLSFDICFAVVCAGVFVGAMIEVWIEEALFEKLMPDIVAGMDIELAVSKTSPLELTK